MLMHACSKENLAYIKLRHGLLDPNVHGIDILIEKHLPVGGGLGGGCHPTQRPPLYPLNALFGLGRTQVAASKTLDSQSARMSPFSFSESSCFASGIGEKLETYIWPGTRVLIADPQIHVSTREVFQHPKLTRDTPSCRIRASQLDTTTNDCEIGSRTTS